MARLAIAATDTSVDVGTMHQKEPYAGVRRSWPAPFRGDIPYVRAGVRNAAMSEVEDLFVALGGHHTVMPPLEAVLRVFLYLAGRI